MMSHLNLLRRDYVKHSYEFKNCEVINFGIVNMDKKGCTNDLWLNFLWELKWFHPKKFLEPNFLRATVFETTYLKVKKNCVY